MRLYTNNKGEWTGTQADAKKAWGKDMALVEVPVSKDALMKWLNKCRVVSQSHAEIAEQFNTPTPDDAPFSEGKPIVMSRGDCPTIGSPVSRSGGGQMYERSSSYSSRRSRLFFFDTRRCATLVAIIQRQNS